MRWLYASFVLFWAFFLYVYQVKACCRLPLLFCSDFNKQILFSFIFSCFHCFLPDECNFMSLCGSLIPGSSVLICNCVLQQFAENFVLKSVYRNNYRNMLECEISSEQICCFLGYLKSLNRQRNHQEDYLYEHLLVKRYNNR